MMLPEELRLRHRAGTGFRHAAGGQLAGQHSFAGRQLVQQCRRDSQAIAARQRLDLLNTTEAGTHYHRVIAMRFVILINQAHRDHARIAVHLIG